ncbi:MAG: S8 family serine peptidase, partial [Nitrososphaeraceae archaeon]
MHERSSCWLRGNHAISAHLSLSIFLVLILVIQNLTLLPPPVAGSTSNIVKKNIPIIMPGNEKSEFVNSTPETATFSGIQNTPDTLSSTLPIISNPDNKVVLQNAAADQYIVLLNKESMKLGSAAGLGETGYMQALKSEYESKGAEVTHVYDNLNGYVIKPTSEINSTDLIKELRDDPRVAYVEADQRVHAFLQTLPTGVDRADGDLSYLSSGNGEGSADVDIAILDTGIDLTHPDLNVYQARTFVAGTSSALDDNGHGTMVAGVSAAKDNSIGVVGMAPGARLWAVKVLDKTGTGLISDIIKGIDYLVGHADEVDVANMSFGCECSSNALNSAINTAVASGITFAAAAGNNNKDASSFSPANNPSVIAVSAIVDTDGKCGAKGPSTNFGSDDRLASFSNYGNVVDIAAPGVSILTTSLNGGFAKFSGTSAAAPHVAGGAAAYKALHPGATPAEVRSALDAISIKPSTVCNGDSHGYFSGDKDTVREPLLSIKDLQADDTLPNQPPTADSKSVTTTMNTPVDVTLSGQDPEGGPLTFSIVDQPTHGTLGS